ncbi:unnamed protein product [Alopecurus aequalis]
MGPAAVHRCFAPLFFLLLLCHNAAAGTPTWCVASMTANDVVLQAGINWACGAGGADCSPIQPGGSCAVPNTVRYHASYAFNSYYHINPTPKSCDFGGIAFLTTTDPSSPTCKYPASHRWAIFSLRIS